MKKILIFILLLNLNLLVHSMKQLQELSETEVQSRFQELCMGLQIIDARLRTCFDANQRNSLEEERKKITEAMKNIRQFNIQELRDPIAGYQASEDYMVAIMSRTSQ